MKVKELLNETNWVKNHSALDENNEDVFPTSEEACKWCLLGALIKCYIVRSPFAYIYSYEDVDKRSNEIKEKLENSVVAWNDDPERKWEDIENLIEELDI